MQIPINKDFEKDYKDNLWKGFSMPESISILAALLCCLTVLAILYLKFGIPLDVAPYCSIPFAVPPLAAGFWKSKSGLSLKQYLNVREYVKRTKLLLYEPDEYIYGDIMLGNKEKSKDTNPKRHPDRKEIKKMKKAHKRWARDARKIIKKEGADIYGDL